jgi:hypothetical protein
MAIGRPRAPAQINANASPQTVALDHDLMAHLLNDGYDEPATT